MILSLLTACDNVEWGGAELHMEPPPSATVGEPEAADPTRSGTPGPRMPSRPVLFLATRDGSETTLAPVAEIVPDSLRALPSDEAVPGFRAAFARQRMPAGARFTLFAEGTRVGTFTVEELLTDTSYCQPRPTARGSVELIPEAVDTRRFLALREEDAEGFEHGDFEAPEDDRTQRNASVALAGELIPELGARWPSSLPVARRDMQALRLGVGGPSAFAATFLFLDEMAVAPAEPASYALFVMGVEQGDTYRPAYVWYREAGREGRGVPRLFQHFDWDGDGDTEVLLEVLGEESRWTAALELAGTGWTRVWQDPCGAGAPPVTDEGEG